jgi:hypothetical protein
MKTLIIIGGFLWLAFFVFHIFFWKLFDWKRDLEKLSKTNKAIMQVLNLCLMFCFLIFTYVSIFQTNELLTTSLGKTLLIGMILFAVFRAAEQVIFFDLKNIRSKAVFVAALVGAAIYLIPLYSIVF